MRKTGFGRIGPNAQKLAQTVKAVILDFDGCLTDNSELFISGEKPLIVKGRSYYDGQGVSLLRAIGLRVAIITNEKGESASLSHWLVDKWNKLPSSAGPDNPTGWLKVELVSGRRGVDKLTQAQEAILPIFGCGLEDCVMMADDLVDWCLFQFVGFKAAPSSAEEVIRDRADFVSLRPGGGGAVRDLANFILWSRGIDPLTLPPQ